MAQGLWCIPQIEGTYVARTEDVLDLYAEAPDPGSAGSARRYDCEYRRNGAVNLFIFLEAHRPWRKVKVTDPNPSLAANDSDDPCFPYPVIPPSASTNSQ